MSEEYNGYDELIGAAKRLKETIERYDAGDPRFPWITVRGDLARFHYNLDKVETIRAERDAYKLAAEQLRSMLDRRWVSVEERLPEVDGEYIVVTSGCYTHIAYFLKKIKQWSRGDEIFYSITHWQEKPLPPAPEASDEN